MGNPFNRSARLATTLALLLASAGCMTLGDAGRPLVPTRYKTETGPYAVYTNVPIGAADPAIRHLQSLERQLEANLGLRVEPGDNPVEVYILDDKESFAHFLKFYYPELPPRRAFFLAQGARRVVYTYLGDRLEEDLRHEATHALLHAGVADLPLWLDEGLAEYFECPEGRDGLNPEHFGRLPADLAAGWSPDLARLEALRDVRQMSPRDYRESWAWVHYLLNGPASGKAALLSYLADLRTHPDARPLSSRLDSARAGMLAHLERVRDRPVAANNGPPRDPAVRLQNAAIEPPAGVGRRRGLMNRLRELFGL
jgi:hypothetical protein